MQMLNKMLWNIISQSLFVGYGLITVIWVVAAQNRNRDMYRLKPFEWLVICINEAPDDWVTRIDIG